MTIQTKGKRFCALALASCLVLGAAAPVLALDKASPVADSGMCEAHQVHDEACGYVEAVAGSECGHIHDEACGYDEAKEGAPCKHTQGEHDESCGYREAVEGRECEHTCELCGEPAIDPETKPGDLTEPPACALTEGCTLADGHEGACVTEPADGETEIACALTEGCTLPAGHEGVCVMEPPAVEAGKIIITAFEKLDQAVKYAPLHTTWDGLGLPATLGASGYKVNGGEADRESPLGDSAADDTGPAPEPEPISIEGVTWEVFEKDGSPAAYEENRPTPCIYWLRAVLPEGYALGDSAALPEMELRYGMASRAITTATVGDFQVTGDNTKYTYANNTLTVQDGADLTISGTTTKDKIVVESGATAAITLAGVNINMGNCAFDMTGATVTLTLADNTTNILKSGDERAGLQVPDGAALTITGSGKLEVTSREGAAIGGKGDGGEDNGQKGGCITIEGSAQVTATSVYGAGIGGGYSMSQTGGSGGTTIIQGNAIVIATSSYDGAGIGGGGGGGGGTGGTGGEITIRGNALVTATGASGAGIGGGEGGGGGKITIDGNAVVFAKSMSNQSPMPIGGGAGAPVGSAGDISKTKGVIFELQLNGGFDNDHYVGKVYGDVTLPGDLTIPDGATLEIPGGSSLTVPEDVTLTNNGEIKGDGDLKGDGTFGGNGAFTQKADRTIAAPSVASKTYDSITLNTVTPTGDGTVTYAKNTGNTAPADGWQEGLTFTGLDPDTTYYFFARVTGSRIYNDAASATGTAGTTAKLSVINTQAIPGVTPPALGAVPVTAITKTEQYTGTVAWSPALAADGTFAANTAYTATITLTPKPGYTLQGVAANFFTVAEATTTNAQSSGEITAVFPATAGFESRPSGGGGGSDSGGSSGGTSAIATPKNSYTATGNSINQTVSRSDLKKLADTGKSLTIQSGTANMTFNPAALKAILAAIPSTAGNITFSSAPADLSAFPEAAQLIGSRPAYAFTISYKDNKGNTVTAKVNFPVGAVSIALDYTPVAGEAAGSG